MIFIHRHKTFSLDVMARTDLCLIMPIEQQCHSHPWSQAHFISSIESTHQCYVLRDGRSIVAYCITSTAADEAELLNITVAPDYQRQGIAKQLLINICDLFDNSIQMLFLEVRESNGAAIALYHSLNFNEVGKRPNYYPAKKGREDAIIMAKILGE
jgi:ribosomal-protein-alanine N-acetyltransferase